MAKKVYEESKIQAIADAIREKSGSVALYNTSEMLYGVNEVYEAGKEAGLDAIWDSIQQKGKRTDYSYLFMRWDDSVFYPKYNIVPDNLTIHGVAANVGMFRDFNCDSGNADFDMSARLEECGVTLDTSKISSMQYFIMNAFVKRIPPIDLSAATNCYMTFYNTSLQIIDKLIISETTTFNSNTFQYNSKLTTITEIEGTIAKSIAFQHSPLDVPTMNRVIEHLKDYSSVGGTYTLTLKADRQNMLSAAEKAVATNKGWTLVWS